jgi:hypothetical protein
MYHCGLLVGLKTGHALYNPSFHHPYLAQNSLDLLVNWYMEC